MPRHDIYYISTWEKGVGHNFLTGLELNGEGHILACWHCDEEKALTFPTEQAAIDYMMPMIEDKHPSVKEVRVWGSMSDDKLWKHIGDNVHYMRGMSVIK